MENFQQVKTSLIEQAKANNNLLQKVIYSQTWDELYNVIIDNILDISHTYATFDTDMGWCNDKCILIPDGHYKNNEKEFTILNGKMHGEYVTYWSHGKVREKWNYVEGQKHGEYVSYYIKTGHVNTKGYYIDGKKHGKFIHYWSNEEVHFFEYFFRGARVSKQMEYEDMCRFMYINSNLKSQ
jgi:antitoxin component YwqK of YwqJK toxin-antitoxin module